MNFDYILLYLIIIIVNIIDLYCYKRIKNNDDNKIIFDLKKVIVLLIISLLILYNNIFNMGFIKPVITFLCSILLFYFVFKDKLNILLSYGITVYFLISFVEVILSIILIITKISSYELFENTIIVKSLFSIINILFVYILCNFNLFKNKSYKLSLFFNKSKIFIGIFISLLLFPMALEFKYLNNVNSTTYIMNILLFIIFGIVISILFYYEIKINNEIQKYENLLSFISKYEKIIDEQRIDKHEIHNNLLILKSYKNKNSKEYNELLDDMLLSYSKSDNTIKNMYKLPNGIKGIVYYKLMNVKNNEISVNINISKQIRIKIAKTDNKEYFSLCKILGIILDNAIEAAKECKKRVINVEIYKEKDKIIFMISNTYNIKKLNINKINTLRYSTKGKDRGYGLSIANKLSNSSKYIKISQYLENNMFVSKIEVDN